MKQIDDLKELKEKEGIESVDDILREVIKSGGMSFNNIKPVYRYTIYFKIIWSGLIKMSIIFHCATLTIAKNVS